VSTKLLPVAAAEVGLALSLAALVGCGEAEPESVGTTHQSVVYGQPSGPEDDSVVMIISYTPGGTSDREYCTATLLAPNLIATAKHCVSYYTLGNLACNSDGTLAGGSVGGHIGQLVAPGDVVVKTGQSPNYAVRDAGVAAVGRKIFATGAETICVNDIALVVLDRELTDVPIRPVRLLTGVGPGEHLRVAGYGFTEDAGFGSRFTLSDRVVSAVGTSEFRPQGDSIPPNMFATDRPALCAGDSGGPALSEPTDDEGALVGIFTLDVGGCAKATRNLFVDVASFRDELVLPAFAEAGHDPWCEGTAGPAPCSPPVDAGSDTGGSGGELDAGSGGEATGGAPGRIDLRKKGGCTCDVVGASMPGSASWALLPLLGALACRRRKHNRG
jgi:hypothetical protein